MSKILTGAITGEEAMDPSDPPTSFIIKHEDEKEAEEPEENKQKSDKQVSKPMQQKRQGSEEDTSPPIKVNESQDLQSIRAKVRKLMNS